MLIVNKRMHQRTGLVVQPFGDDGAVHLTPIDGETPGRAFILDADAARELVAAVLAAELPTSRLPMRFSTGQGDVDIELVAEAPRVAWRFRAEGDRIVFDSLDDADQAELRSAFDGTVAAERERMRMVK